MKTGKEILQDAEIKVSDFKDEIIYSVIVNNIDIILADVEAKNEQRNRLQSRVIELEEVGNELRQTIIAKQHREIKLENLLALHQELTQWVEEIYDNDFKFLDNADFVEQLMDKVTKLNK